MAIAFIIAGCSALATGRIASPTTGFMCEAAKIRDAFRQLVATSAAHYVGWMSCDTLPPG
jgi:hypothetical protein